MNPNPAADNPKETHKERRQPMPWWRILEGVGIIAGIGYAVVTYWLWRDQRDAFMANQRAWVRLECAFPDEVGMLLNRAGFPLSATNVGKSPAKTVSVKSVAEIVPANSNPTLQFSKRHTTGFASLIFPSTRLPTAAYFLSPRGEKLPISQADIENLATNRAYLAVYSQAVYEDPFGKHWTRYCEWRPFGDPSGEYLSSGCVAWNAVGDGDPPDWDK